MTLAHLKVIKYFVILSLVSFDSPRSFESFYGQVNKFPPKIDSLIDFNGMSTSPESF